MPPPDELRIEYEDIMRMGRREGGGNIAPAVLAEVGSRDPVEMRLHREYRVAELTANVMSIFLTRPAYYENLLQNVDRDLTINGVPEDHQRQIYDHILRIVREAKKSPRLNRDAVVNRLKLQRMMSGKHGDVESTVGSFLTTDEEPFEVQKSKALASVGRPGVRDFSSGAPAPGGAGPAAAGAGGPAGGRRKTTRRRKRTNKTYKRINRNGNGGSIRFERQVVEGV